MENMYWPFLCQEIFWDYLCPRAWDHVCPAFMELRVNLRCQIVCVYLTYFLNLRIKGQSVPPTGLGTICAQHLGSCGEFEVSLSLFFL